MLSDGLKELEWVLSLTQLVELITEIINDKENEAQVIIKNQLKNWYDTLPNYIKGYLPNLVCES
ncbi:hypothetical protein [uncultured Enterococcus sp.]|uniref:hypothetical protein n=1 Tax=uncultured Enterococcus sp. TaxID=167972 RepID=UPI00260589D5|nr:hypothetical protein [uncultured Enterococcus sp.]